MKNQKQDGKVQTETTGEKSFLEIVEQKIGEFKFEDLDLMTLLMLGLYREKYPEQVETPVEPELSAEELELKELREELNTAKQQLKNNQKRLEGGVYQVGPGMTQEVPPIEDEIELLKDRIRVMELEMQYDVPKRAKYMYEENDEWRGLVKKNNKRELESKKKVLERVLQQKDNILQKNTELEAKIPELEEKIKKMQENGEVKINSA